MIQYIPPFFFFFFFCFLLCNYSVLVHIYRWFYDPFYRREGRSDLSWLPFIFDWSYIDTVTEKNVNGKSVFICCHPTFQNVTVFFSYSFSTSTSFVLFYFKFTLYKSEILNAKCIVNHVCTKYKVKVLCTLYINIRGVNKKKKKKKKATQKNKLQLTSLSDTSIQDWICISWFGDEWKGSRVIRTEPYFHYVWSVLW